MDFGVDLTEKTENAKVLIATPNYTNVFSSESHTSHMECTTAWTKWGINFSWSIVGRTFVHFARTMLCQAAIDGGFTHVFWLDDDAVISPDLLPRFLEHDKEVMITPYYMRRSPYEIGVLVSTVGEFHDHGSYRNLTLSDMNQGLIEVDGGGTHCMLIKVDCFTKRGEKTAYHNPYPPKLMEVLDRLSAEDKDIIDHYVGELPDESMNMIEENDMGKPYFVMPKVGTEDMLWCYRAKKKGIKIWCDTDVDCGHVGFNPVVTRIYRERAEVLQSNGADHTNSGIPRIQTDRRPEGQDLEAEIKTMERNNVIDSKKAANLV